MSVMLIESRSWRYYLIGEINKPGEFPIDYPITLLQVLARSGGFREWAKTSKILVIRRKSGGEQRLKFNYDSVIKGDDIEQNIVIEPGDTIIIP